MNKIAVGKTLLNIYPNLSLICDKIDSEVNSSAMLMAETADAYLGTMLNFYNNVTNVIYRKSMLVNLKIYLEEALASLSEEMAGLLYLKYVDKFSTKQICDFTEQPLRQVERKLMQAINMFSIALTKVGLTGDVFSKVLKNEKWINEIYLFFEGGKKEEQRSCNIKIVNGLISEQTINKLTNKAFRCI